MSDPSEGLKATAPPPQKRGLFGGVFTRVRHLSEVSGAGAKRGNLMTNFFGGLVATWPKEKAFLCILYGCALIDGKLDAREVEEIVALGHRLNVFDGKSQEQVDQILAEVREKLQWDRKSEFPWSQIDGACAALERQKLADVVFANACDIVFADRAIDQAEVDYLNRIGSKLGIASETGAEIVRVLQIKNGHIGE